MVFEKTKKKKDEMISKIRYVKILTLAATIASWMHTERSNQMYFNFKLASWFKIVIFKYNEIQLSMAEDLTRQYFDVDVMPSGGNFKNQ